MIYSKPIEYPPPAFNPGDRVRFRWPEDYFEGGTHTVVASGHTHTLLEGFEFATFNWLLKRVHKAAQKSTEEPPKRDREKGVKLDAKKLRTSENPLKDTRPTGECPIYFCGIGFPPIFQSLKFFQILRKFAPWKR